MNLKGNAKYLILRQRFYEDWNDKNEKELADYISQQVYSRCDLTAIRNRIDTILAVDSNNCIRMIYRLVGIDLASGYYIKTNRDFDGFSYRVVFDKELAQRHFALIGKQIYTPSSLPVRTVSEQELAEEIKVAQSRCD